MDKITVDNVVISGADKVDSQLRVEGLLVIEGDDCYIVSGRDARQNRIDLYGDDIIDALLDEVPCYIGGDFLYEDEAIVEGVLKNNGSGNGYILSNIKMIVLYRGDEEFIINY